MPLSGEAKTSYQREYMRRRRAAQHTTAAGPPRSLDFESVADWWFNVATEEDRASLAAAIGGVILPEGTTATDVARAAVGFGVPVEEMADFVLVLGQDSFGRKLRTMSGQIPWWLIKMHSKYPTTFNVGAWEGSCGHLAIDKLYAERGVPIGKYQEWEAEWQAQAAKKTAKRSKKAAR